MTRVLHRAIHAVPVRVSGRHRDGRPVRRERYISDMQRDSQACTGPCVLWTMTRLEWNTCSGPSFLGVRVIYRHGLRVAPLDGACWNCNVVRRPGNRARGSTRPARAARSKMAIILDERAAAADSFDDNVIRQRQSDVCCCSAGRLPFGGRLQPHLHYTFFSVLSADGDLGSARSPPSSRRQHANHRGFPAVRRARSLALRACRCSWMHSIDNGLDQLARSGHCVLARDGNPAACHTQPARCTRYRRRAAWRLSPEPRGWLDMRRNEQVGWANCGLPAPVQPCAQWSFAVAARCASPRRFTAVRVSAAHSVR